MKKYIPQIAAALLLAIMLVVFPIHGAHATNTLTDAATSVVGGFLDVTLGVLIKLFSYLIYVVLMIASFGLTISAAILNVSIFLTTNLGIFIDNTPAIYQVWTVLRDVCGMFLIFLLLIAAFQTILGIEKANYKQVLTNIVIVGILINFSFFFTSVMIDASNIVSLQLYNAIAPSVSADSCGSSSDITDLNKKGLGTASYFTCISGQLIGSNGGLATVIVNSLDITRWWSTQSALKNQGSDQSEILIGIRLILINSGAIVVTVLAAISLLGAAAAAIWRVCVLIMLLAFSPLWIAGRVLPQIKSEVSDKWWKHLKANLLFLPVYLLLMYVVISIITTLNLGSVGTGSGMAASTLAIAVQAGNNWYAPFLQLSVGFAIVIFLINLPLVTALSVSGSSGMITEKFANKVSSTVGSWMGRNTLGRAAYSLNDSRAMKNIVSRAPGLGGMVSTGLSKVGSSGFGVKKDGSYEARLKSQKKAQEGMHKKLGNVDRGDFANDQEFKLAKDQAKEYQAAYRSNLAWGNTPTGGILGFMLDNRSYRQTVAKLKKEVDSKKAKDNFKQNKKDLATMKDEYKKLDEKVQDATKDIGFKKGGIADPGDVEKLKKLAEQIESKQEDVDKGEEEVEKEKSENLANAVSGKLKDEGGGKKDKEEKSEKT